MAKGLRKLIKQANRLSTTSTLARRLKRKRFGPRLRVEELEDRIAPAVTFTVDPGEYVPIDTDGGVGIILNDSTSTASFDITIEDGGAAGTADTISIDLNDAGAVVLQTNCAITSGAAGTAIIDDSANVSLTLQTGRTGAQLDLDGGPASVAAAADLSYFDGTDAGTNDSVAATLAAGDNATRTDAQVDAGSDLGGDVIGAITLDNDAAASDLTELTISAAGTDDGDFTGALTVRDDVTDVTIDGTATGAWNIDGSATGGAISIGATAASTDIDIAGDLASTFDTTTGAIAGDIIVTGDITGAVTADNGLSGAIQGDSISGAIVVTDGSLSGSVTSVTGNIGNVTVDTGGTGAFSGTITSAGTFGTLTAGGDISGDVTADTTIAGIVSEDGDITATSTITAGGTITLIEADADESATSGDFAGAIVQSAGNIGTLDFGGDVTAAISSTGTIGATAGITIDGSLQAVITAATGFTGNPIQIDDGITAAGGLTATAGGFAGAADITIDTGGMAGDIIATAGDLAADITVTAGGLSGSVIVTNDDLTGALTVTAGGLSGTVRATTGDITGAITVSDDGVSGTIEALAGDVSSVISIGDADADNDGELTGVIQAPTAATGDIDGATITINNGITSTGAILAGGEISADITINEDGIEAGTTSTTGIIRAGTDVSGAILITDGGLSGAIRAVSGDVNGGVTVTAGGITATGMITAGTDVDAVTIVAGGLAGSIVADHDVVGLIDITGGIAATGAIEAGEDLVNITVATGDIAAGATITAGVDIRGTIQTTLGDILADISAENDITAAGVIYAADGAISGTVTASLGDLSGTVQADNGSIAEIVVGGDINAATISAEDDITTITVTGGILAGTTITASDTDVDGTGDIGTITAGDGINATILAINIGTIRSGGLSTENIAGTITATGDIDVVDAGAGLITATVTAQTAVPGSAMATFINDSVSYAVWAITGTPTAPTEPTADAAVSAELIFIGGAAPDLEINDLAGTTAATSIYVTSRSDTGAEQLFWDPDVNVYDAPITLSALTASSAITIGTVYVEGSYTTIGADSDITINNLIVEGGVGGTLAIGVGEDIDFGWVQADLTINVAGSGQAGDLTLDSNQAPGTGTGYAINGGATVLVNGSLTDVYLGDSSAGFTGDLGTAALVATLTATGSIGDIFVDGDVLGNIRATQMGDIEVDGSIGDTLAASIDITASTGDIGDIKVDGQIGGDAGGDTVTIQATAATASIGEINAVGAIGASAAASDVVTIVAGDNIGKVESTDNIGDANSQVLITAANGTIGSVMAGGTYGINAAITAGSDIGTVAATDTTEDNGLIAGSILSHTGNIGNVITYEADITADVTATAGNIDGVDVMDDPSDAGFSVDDGEVTGDITAGGDIDTITGHTVTGTIIAGAATTGSPVTVFTIGDIAYDFDATAGPLYGYTFAGGTISITIDNWDGAAAYASTVDISLTTYSALTGDQTADDFNLSALDFTPASIVNGTDDLGTVRVDGNLNILDTGTLLTLIVEEDVNGPIVVADHATTAVTAFAAGSVTGVPDPTLAQMEAVFEDLGGGPVTFGAPADQTFAIPVDEDISFAIGSASGSLVGIDGAPLVMTGDGLDEFLVTVASGAISAVQGTIDDLGGVLIDGDLDIPMTFIDLNGITVTGSILSTGSIVANNIDFIWVGTDIDDYIAENGPFADDAAAQTWLDGNGNMAGTITCTNVIDNGTLNGDIGDIDILGDWTGDISAEGDVGDINVGQTLDAPDSSYAAITGMMDGTLFVGGDCGDIDVMMDVVPTADSYIAIVGDLGDDGIVSEYGNIGGSGLIMIGGFADYFEAYYGTIAADIFTGGDGSDEVEMHAQAITGDMAFGMAYGIDSLEMNLYETPIDGNPDQYTVEVNDDSMMVEIASGNITDTGATVDRVTILHDDADELDLYTNTENNIDLNELFLLGTDWNLYTYVEGDIGNVVASFDVATAATNTAGKTSDQIQSIFLNNYNTEEGTAISLDVIDDANPTDLDDWLNEVNNQDLQLEVWANNLTGGVIASGNLDVTVDWEPGLDVFGYLCSLNGTVDADIYANDEIGSVAASSNIDVSLQSEGVVAVDDGSDMQADVTAYGLEGLPAWFAGGIMSEIGNIEVGVLADGEQTLVAGVPMSSSDAVLGTIYAMVGTVDGSLTLGGDFGGIVAPNETSLAGVTLNMPNYSQIGMFVAPYANGNDPLGNHPDAQLSLLNGQILVSENNPYVDGYDTITAVGSGTLVYLTTGGDVYVLNGMNDAAASVTIEGDIDELTVETDWAGVISVLGNADGDLGEMGWLTVNGDIDQSTADLVAFNFSGYTHNGDVTGTSSVDAYQFVDEGTLDSSTRSITWENMAGDDQTLYVNASRAMHARYTTFFGKLDEVEITGQGNADVVSVNGSYDASDHADARALKSMARQAVKPGHDIFDSHGTANLGSLVANRGFGRATLRNVVIDGYNEVVNVDGSIRGLRITGDADWISVSRSINNAFINTHVDLGYIQSDRMANVSVFGNVYEFDAIKANKVYISGNVDQMSGQNWTRVAVDGGVESLWMFAGTHGGRLVNCRFGYVTHENIDNRKWLETAESVAPAGGGDGDVGETTLRNINPYYNPVKVIRTIAPGLNPWSSDEYDD